MDRVVITYLIIDIILLVPIVLIIFKRESFSAKYEISKIYARLLGFLISINGAIRAGKTSFQSGLSHLFQIEIESLLTENIDLVKKVYKKVDFNIINKMLDERFSSTEAFDFKGIEKDLISLIDLLNIKNNIIFNFITSKSTKNHFKDYIFAYWVLNYRRNYVQSKTKFYSHVTGSFNYDYKVEQQKIFRAFEDSDYSIYDYMVELIDELSDELGANKRYEDVKEEDGDKDYRRKYGQIHQERNRLITTKQDSKDEIKKFRTLTQSNLWIPNKVQIVGTFRFTMTIINFICSLFLLIYNMFLILIPYVIKSILYRTNNQSYNEYKESRYNAVNIKRNLHNKILYLDWFFMSIGYNKYEVWNYPSEEDVKKRDPIYYDKMMFYIPTIYCFGTYDTHFYRMIQQELLAETKTKSTEVNWFLNPDYFDNEPEIGGDKDDIDF